LSPQFRLTGAFKYILPKYEDDASLVGGLDHFSFFHILGIIIPTAALHHFSEG
jgi:hypothetical protein